MSLTLILRTCLTIDSMRTVRRNGSKILHSGYRGIVQRMAARALALDQLPHQARPEAMFHKALGFFTLIGQERIEAHPLGLSTVQAST